MRSGITATGVALMVAAVLLVPAALETAAPAQGGQTQPQGERATQGGSASPEAQRQQSEDERHRATVAGPCTPLGTQPIAQVMQTMELAKQSNDINQMRTAMDQAEKLFLRIQDYMENCAGRARKGKGAAGKKRGPGNLGPTQEAGTTQRSGSRR